MDLKKAIDSIGLKGVTLCGEYLHIRDEPGLEINHNLDWKDSSVKIWLRRVDVPLLGNSSVHSYHLQVVSSDAQDRKDYPFHRTYKGTEFGEALRAHKALYEGLRGVAAA